MAKRREIIKKITTVAKAQGMTFAFKRSGGNHDIFDLDGAMIPIGHHKDFSRWDTEDIYKECEAKLGKDWWR